MNRRGYVDWFITGIIAAIVILIGLVVWSSNESEKRFIADYHATLARAQTRAESLQVDLAFKSISASRSAEASANMAAGMAAGAMGAAMAGRK